MADPAPKQKLIRHLSNFEVNDWSPVREGDDVDGPELTLMLDDAQGLTAATIARTEAAQEKTRAELAAAEAKVAEHDATRPASSAPKHVTKYAGKVRRFLVERCEPLRAKLAATEKSLALAARYLAELQALRNAASL